MLPRSAEPQRAVSRNDVAGPESLAGGCIDSSIKITGSQKPGFWKQER